MTSLKRAEPDTRLVPWPELQSLLGPLSQAQFESLLESVREDGQRVPILALPDGRIIDGTNRALACRQLGLEPLTQTVDLDEASAFRLGLALNADRRQLSPDQLRELRHWQRRTYLAARTKGNTQVEAAALAGVPRQTGAAWEANPGQNSELGIVSFPDLRVKVGKRAKEQIAARIVAGEKVEQIAADAGITPRHVRRIAAQHLTLPEPVPQDGLGGLDWQVITGDMEELDGLLVDDSVDLFCSDPPYGRQYVSLFGRLAELARRKLRPGGLCLTLCGHFYLPEVLSSMLEHLDYWWIFGFPLTGQHPVAWPRQVWVAWRPVLVMRKPGPAVGRGWVLDFPPGGRQNKRYHPWQQAVEPIIYWVDRLTQSADLVVDPFAGTGTTAVACKLTGRRFIGTEVDPQVAETARRRIASTERSQRTFNGTAMTAAPMADRLSPEGDGLESERCPAGTLAPHQPDEQDGAKALEAGHPTQR